VEIGTSDESEDMHPVRRIAPNILTITVIYLIVVVILRQLVNNWLSVGNCKRWFDENWVENRADMQTTFDSCL